jgi:poly(hydroxyalkanoate) depolymerase family esterase
MLRAMMPSPAASRRTVKKVQRTATKAARAATRSATGSRAGAPTKRRKAARSRPARSTSSALPELWQPPGGARQQPDPATLGQGTWHQHRYTGVAGTRAYRVYIPKGLRRTTRAPVLLALHGCTQTGLDFAAGTRFNDLADTHKFIVVYPEQAATHHAQRCWNWFRTGHQMRATGEPAILAGIVRRVGQETTRWRVNADRIYVAGISAGGGMALVLAATYPELFAAVGVHSAPPFRVATGPADALAAMQGAGQVPTPTAPLPPLIIFQGTADGTVRASNAERIAGQWLDSQPEGSIGKGRQTRTAPPRTASGRGPRPHRVTRWSAQRRVQLELWVVEGLGHAWSGGSAKGSYSDSRGPRASTQMWRFFARHAATQPTGLAAH